MLFLARTAYFPFVKTLASVEKMVILLQVDTFTTGFQVGKTRLLASRNRFLLVETISPFVEEYLTNVVSESFVLLLMKSRLLQKKQVFH